MANQASVGVSIKVLGDGSSLTATIVLDGTPYYTNQALINFSSVPSSVFGATVADQFGQPVPATAALLKNGKQVVITFSAAFTGVVTVTFNLGYNV